MLGSLMDSCCSCHLLKAVSFLFLFNSKSLLFPGARMVPTPHPLWTTLCMALRRQPLPPRQRQGSRRVHRTCARAREALFGPVQKTLHMTRFGPVRKKLLGEKKIIGRKKDGRGQFDGFPFGRWPARPWPGQVRHQYKRISSNWPKASPGQKSIN